MKLSLIIPVYHEEKTIVHVIKSITAQVKTPFEALIVYDDPSDPTTKTAQSYILRKKIKNVHLIQNEIGNRQGVLNAIKTGIKKAKGEAVVITMADLSDDVTQIDEMYALIHKGYDIVAASRYMPGGEKIGGPFIKTFLSKTAGLTLHWFFKVPTHDATNAYKMYRRRIFKDIEIESTGGFEYSLEITLKAFKKGYRITEIPTEWHDDPKGKSHFKLWAWLPKYIKTYLLVIQKSS